MANPSASTASSSIPFAIFLLLLLLRLPSSSTAADAGQFPFVYKGCANRTFSSYSSSSGGGVASDVWEQAVASLSSALLAKAISGALFYKTSVSGSPIPLFGLYQCRGDLSPPNCADCVARVPPLWSSLCGPAVAARVQLAGCYALYQVPGFPQVAGTKMLYDWCSSATTSGEGFEERRDTAFADLQARAAAAAGGSAGRRTGFYSAGFGDVNALAQCEGDLSMGDCGECLAEALQKVAVECGRASAGQMYLDKCYISYGDGGVSVGGGGNSHPAAGEPPQSTQKTVAIVLGGAAGVGLLIVLLLYLVSVYKKREYY